MTKKFLFLALAILMVISPVLTRADYSNTVSYLESQSQNVWITQALVAADVADPDISYLDTNTTDVMTAIKGVLALSATKHSDITEYGNLLDTIYNRMSVGQLGSVDLLNDDFWGLIALSSVGETESIAELRNFILAHQNSDGGWSWSTTGDSDSNDTAAAVMALLETNFDTSSVQITNALTYLASTQNQDGGFGYDAESDSDGASTAWVIAALNKLGTSASTWEVEDNNPLSFLQSLEQADGSFLWLPSDNQSSSMVTAYALLVLSGDTYPVNYVELSGLEEDSGLSLRIEGPDSTICQASHLSATTVLDILIAGAQACNFDYVAQDSAYGVYVSLIGGIEAAGMEGWQYWVDWQPAMVGVADYQLLGNEDVLWAFGGWPLYPTSLEISDSSVSAGDNLLITTKYYDGSSWQNWPQAFVYVGEELYQTDQEGHLALSMTNDGVYPVWAEANGAYVRSNKKYLAVGDGVSQSVDLSVNIESGDGNTGQGDSVAFSVSQSSINFGSLRAGQSAETIVSLTNTGSVPVYIEASILGSQLLTDYVSLNQSAWDNFNLSLAQADTSSVNVGLSVPADWVIPGNQNGQLIFWGAGLSQ